MKICFVALALLGMLACQRPAQQSEFRLRRVAADAQAGGDSAISPDGKRFLTTLRRSGNWDVWMYDLVTNQWSQITNDPSDEFEARWSPDGKSIVYTSTKRGNKGVFAMRLDERKPISLTDDPEDDEYPVFSPDGKTVVFTGGPWLQRRYFLIDVDGTNRHAVSDPSKAGACSFHPSGDSLICHNYDSGTGNVYLYPTGGGQRLRITDGNFWDYKPSLSPDGRWIAVSRSEEGPSVIWLMPFPAGNGFPLTQSGNDDRWPTWSASGNSLLFHRLVDEGRGIQSYDRRTGKITQIINADEKPGAASFDNTGRRIVYSWRSGQREQLRIRDLTDGSTLDLKTSGEASFPRWSPDGRRIAFALKDGEHWDVATIDVASQEIKIWTDGQARGIRDVLDWAPDSRRIIYHASTLPFEANLYILDTSSGIIRNLTNDHHFSQSPAFTPDGKGVTFMSTRGGNWTWGFFLLTLASNDYKLLMGPDYTEKNYPRLDTNREIIWSEFDLDGKEYLATRNSKGENQLLKEAGSFARWPSLSPDGQIILYTTLNHSVEYWIAEGLNSPQSPLKNPANQIQVTSCSPKKEETSSQQQNAASARSPNRSGRRASPVQLHHR